MTESSRQEYKEMQNKSKRVVTKANLKAYEGLYERLDTKRKKEL